MTCAPDYKRTYNKGASNCVLVHVRNIELLFPGQFIDLYQLVR